MTSDDCGFFCFCGHQLLGDVANAAVGLDKQVAGMAKTVTTVIKVLLTGEYHFHETPVWKEAIAFNTEDGTTAAYQRESGGKGLTL